MTPTTRPAYDSQSEVAALTVGSGIVLTQTFALFPGLLPCLLLLLPFVLPLVVLGLVGGVLVGLPLGAWKLGAAVARSVRPSRPDDQQPAATSLGRPAVLAKGDPHAPRPRHPFVG
jgi:hypothetical protein